MNALRNRWRSGIAGKLIIVAGFLFGCMLCGVGATLMSGPDEVGKGTPVAVAGTPVAVAGTPVAVAGTPVAVAGTPVAVAVATTAKATEVVEAPTATPEPISTPAPIATPASTSTPAPIATPASTSTPAPTATPEPTATATPTPTPTLAPEEALRAAVAAALGKGNREAPRVKDVILFDDGAVSIGWAINDNFSERWVKSGARADVVDILRAVRDSGAPVTQVDLAGTFSMADVYGNVNESIVVRARYSAETMARLNLDNILLEKTIYEAADSIKVHPEFLGE